MEPEEIDNQLFQLSNESIDNLAGKTDPVHIAHIKNCPYCRDKFYNRPLYKRTNHVDRWIELVLNGDDVDQDVRTNLVTVLHRSRGMSLDEIVDLLMSKARWSDLDRSLTEYHVGLIIKKGLRTRKDFFDALFIHKTIPKYK